MGERVGGHRPIVWGDYSSDEKIIYKIYRCLWMAADRQRLTQQQPKTGFRNGGEYGEDVRRSGGTGGSAIPLFWGR